MDSKPTVGSYILRNDSTHISINNGNHGEIEWANGNKYTGQIENYCPHGDGRMDFNNDNIYEGDWSNGLFEGYGTFRWANGKVYKGFCFVIQGNIKKVSSMELESLSTRSLADTKEHGKMESRMGMENYLRIIF